jgi:transposase-like protein
MAASRFETSLTQINALTGSQCAHLPTMRMALVIRGRAAAVIAAVLAEQLLCPCCQRRAFYRHGPNSGPQGSRWRACCVTFKGFNGTPLARLRQEAR